jgi:hypothetical protein
MPNGSQGARVASTITQLWTGRPGIDIYNATVDYYWSLQSTFEHQQILINPNWEGQQHTLNLRSFWRQKIVHVKLGVIPPDKQMMVTFVFILSPRLGNAEIFVGDEYQPDASVAISPAPNTWREYARAVLIQGDGHNYVDVFLRSAKAPGDTALYFIRATWEEIG